MVHLLLTWHKYPEYPSGHAHTNPGLVGMGAQVPPFLHTPALEQAEN